MSLIDFTTPFTGGPAYFTGSSAPSSLVPWTFPVAIDGHAYQIDTAAPFQRAYENRLRESTDNGTIPGEATINPQGLWRRGQTSWHLGAGQRYADTSETAVTERFWSSKGVDPWTEGELSLLYDTDQALSSANTNLPLCVAGDRVFVGDGNNLKWSSDLSSWTTVTTGAPGTAITSLATDGTTVYIGYTANGVYSHTPGTTSVASFYPSSPSQSYQVMAYAKGRLWAGHDNHLELPAASGSHSAFFEHDNASFYWTGICTGQNAVYAAGYAGDISLVYKITIQADGTLDTPVVAGELPSGETITSMFGYLGFVVLGTSRGVRFCTADGDANLTIGPVLPTTSDVKCGIGYGRHVWYGWTNYDGSDTGLGRMDLGQFVAQGQPAYASDLMATTQGNVLSVTIFNGTPVFSVSGQGVYKQSADLVASGRLVTGIWRWSIPDVKFLPFVDLQTESLLGQVTVCRTLDGGNCVDVGTMLTEGITTKTFDGPTTAFRECEFDLVLTRSATTTEGPTLQRWQARAVPAPTRSELFSIPLLLHKTVDVEGRDFYFDVTNEMAFLRSLVDDAKIVQLQVGSDTYKALVENVEFTVDGMFGYPFEFEGTAVVTLRSLVA